MTSLMDVIYNLLRFLGLLSEPPLLRKNIKRNRVYDDFSSDDETPVLGYKQVKRFRWSDIINIKDKIEEDSKHSTSVRNSPVQAEGSYSTSTPNESPQRTIPLNLLGSTRHGPTIPIKKTTTANPVTDVEVILEQKEPTARSKTQNNSSVVDVDLDEDVSYDDHQDNDIIFVRKVFIPPTYTHKDSLAESNHDEALNDQVPPKTLEELKPVSDVKIDNQNLLWGIAKTNIENPMTKRKPDGPGKPADATSPQKTQLSKLNEIKLDRELDAVLPKVLGELKPNVKLEYQNLLWGLARNNIIKPMSKRKYDDFGKLADVSSPQKIHGNKCNVIKLDNNFNGASQQNASKTEEPDRVSLLDSSDSDVEEVPQVFSTRSSARKDLERKSRNWLLELDSQYNKEQKTVDNDDARRISVIASKVNSDKNVIHSPRIDATDASEILLTKLGSKYKQSNDKTRTPERQDKPNYSRSTSDVTLKGNGERNAGRSSVDTIDSWLAEINAKYSSTPKPLQKLNEVRPSAAQSSKPHITEDWLLKLESKYKTDQLKSQEKFREKRQESEVVSKVNTELDITREWLARLEAEYLTPPKKTQENVSNTRHVSNIAPKVNDDIVSFRNDVFTVESKYERNLPKTQDQLDGALLSDIPKKKSQKDEARSYLPADARDWLSKLDDEFKTASKKQEDLNKARQALKSASKVNVEPNELGSAKPNSVDHWRTELQSRYNAEQRMRQQEPNTSQESETKLKVGIEKGEARSNILDVARQRLSKLESKNEQTETQIIPDDNNQEVKNVSNVNSERNEARSFKFNTSEDLMKKLGFLYNSHRQESHERSNNSSEQNLDHMISDDEDMEIQPIVNFDLPALTPEQEKIVESGLQPEPEDELLVEKFNMTIHRRDLQTLVDENWLNDEVINFYMNLIMQRSEERDNLPKVYATNTFFYDKLLQSGQAGLKRWTRKVDIFAYDLFVVPINIGRHWCLSLVDFRSRVIKYLDSQGLPNYECLEALKQYLKDEHLDKKGVPFDSKGWQATCVKDIPQQMNGSDCGMFACTFAEFSSRDAAYSFTQAHMPYLRRKAALEILTGKLLL